MQRNIGADGRTRTGTACATAPSRRRVYQFHHIGFTYGYGAGTSAGFCCVLAGALPDPLTGAGALFGLAEGLSSGMLTVSLAAPCPAGADPLGTSEAGLGGS